MSTERKKDLAAMKADMWARKQGEYNPQKIRNLLEGNFKPLFESDEEFNEYMKILEESRESQRHECRDE